VSEEVIISGNTAYRAPPTVEVNLEPAPSEQPKDVENVVMRRIGGEPIHHDDSGSELREEIRKRREGAEDPITEWRADDVLPEPGPSESTDKQIRKASESLYRARMAATAAEFEQFPGVNPEQGRIAAEAVATMPPTKVVPVGDAGQPIQPLRDDQPVTELDSFQNMNEAKRAMSQYRDHVGRQQVALLNELQAREDQQNAELNAALNAPVAPEPAPQQQQPDALAHERARLAEQQQRIAVHTNFQRLSAQGQAAANELAQLQQWAAQNYTPGELAGNQPVQGDERAAWLAEASNRFNELESIVRNANTVAQASQQHIAAARQAQIDQWAQGQDDQFNSQLAARHRSFAANPDKMRSAAKEYLKRTTGLTDAQIAQQWRAGRWRSAPEQMILADAVAHQMGRDSLKSLPSKRVHAPPPVAPGVYRPAGADAEADVAALQRALDNAPTQRAQLAIARKLTQAKRAAGQLNQG